MKRKYLSLGLALVMALTLCACGGGAVNGTSTGKEDGKLASGTWQQQETGDTDLLSYSAQDLTGPIPEDWTLPSDFKTGDKVRVEVSGDKILYGDIVDGGYLNGFTVAQYADGNLTTVSAAGSSSSAPTAASWPWPGPPAPTPPSGASPWWT